MLICFNELNNCFSVRTEKNLVTMPFVAVTRFLFKATTRFELVIKVLQTSVFKSNPPVKSMVLVVLFCLALSIYTLTY